MVDLLDFQVVDWKAEKMVVMTGEKRERRWALNTVVVMVEL